MLFHTISTNTTVTVTTATATATATTTTTTTTSTTTACATATTTQGLSQDLETGCLNLAIVKFLGVQIFKGKHNILTFQP